MTIPLDPRATIHVARQPILDVSGRVFGYELLYREDTDSPDYLEPTDITSARVLTDAILTIGLDTLTNGLPAFLNLTRQLLVESAATLLPPASAVLELRPDVPADAEVIDACRTLHGMGYSLALDDYC